MAASSSPADAYRLWRLWQQMHCLTPLAPAADNGVDLVTLDRW